MKLQHIVEYVCFSVLGWFVRLWPLGTVQRMGASLGERIYSLGFRRSVTLENLRFAYPEKTPLERETIARASYRNVGTALFEFLWFPCLSPERIKELARIENPEVVRAIHGRGKGVILLTAHFGNWELLAIGTPIALGIPASIIVKPQSNPYVDKKINRWRAQCGNIVVPMSKAVREMFRALEAGGIVGIIADQSAPKENVAIEFFGRNVPTYEGPAVFSLKTGAPIMIGFAIRQPDGTYQSHYEEIPTVDLTEYNEQNVTELTRRHVEITERFIRQYPDHWMWMHKRWKHALGTHDPNRETV
ncbi:MAG: lysophospholipid acyltransferase family protein [Ignavibacteriae bacterium]|nr:lysophospholipid acyltransferase family protein [Ignavibacteriota bacterium]